MKSYSLELEFRKCLSTNVNIRQDSLDMLVLVNIYFNLAFLEDFLLTIKRKKNPLKQNKPKY